MAVLTRRLDFEPELETEFQTAFANDNREFLRIAFVIGCCVYPLFAVWDYSTDPVHAWQVLPIRIGVAGFLSLVVSINRFNDIMVRYQAARASYVSIAGFSLIAILMSLQGGLETGVAGITMVMFFNFAFLRLFLIPSLIVGVSLWLAYNAAQFALGVNLLTCISNNFFLIFTLVIGGTNSYNTEKQERSRFLMAKEIALQKAVAESLLDNVLPAHIAERLKHGERHIAESHGEASVLFCDMVGFTTLSKRLSPGHLVELLNEFFSIMDTLAEKHGIEKIKTIGDSYMAVSGVTGNMSSSVEAIADFALDLVSEVRTFVEHRRIPVDVRIGISTGHVISGVIGSKKFSFDLWGETVNLASRMESHSEKGCIQITEATYWRLRDRYVIEERGTIQVKGLGAVQTYFLKGRMDGKEER